MRRKHTMMHRDEPTFNTEGATEGYCSQKNPFTFMWITMDPVLWVKLKNVFRNSRKALICRAVSFLIIILCTVATTIGTISLKTGDMEGITLINYYNGGCASYSANLETIDYSTLDGKYARLSNFRPRELNYTHLYSYIASSLLVQKSDFNKNSEFYTRKLKVKMPSSQSFHATTLSEGGKTKSKQNKTPKDRSSVTEEELKRKRGRDAAQLNSSNNESFAGSERAKEAKGLKHDESKRVTRRNSLTKEERKDVGLPMEVQVDDTQDKWLENELLQEDEESAPLKRSTPLNSGDSSFAPDDTIIPPPDHLDEVMQNREKLLDAELEEFDKQYAENSIEVDTAHTPLQPTLGEILTYPVFLTRDSKLSTSKSKRSSFFFTFWVNQLLFLGSAPGISQASSANCQQLDRRPITLINTMNFSEEVKKVLEARVKRDRDFPYKVAIFSRSYQNGGAGDMLTMPEKDIIGRCIGQGLSRKNRDGEKIVTNDEIRLAAGMAIINCKNQVSADWIINAMDKVMMLAKNIGTPLREDINLTANHIGAVNPFKTFSITNTNKQDTWEDTVAWLNTAEVETEGWLLLNSRTDRNQMFTFIDTKRRLHQTFEGGRDGRRIKAFLSLAMNITLRWTTGEDENGNADSEIAQRAIPINYFFYFLQWSHSNRSYRQAELAWDRCWPEKPPRLSGTAMKMMSRADGFRLKAEYNANVELRRTTKQYELMNNEVESEYESFYNLRFRWNTFQNNSLTVSKICFTSNAFTMGQFHLHSTRINNPRILIEIQNREEKCQPVIGKDDKLDTNKASSKAIVYCFKSEECTHRLSVNNLKLLFSSKLNVLLTENSQTNDNDFFSQNIDRSSPRSTSPSHLTLGVAAVIVGILIFSNVSGVEASGQAMRDSEDRFKNSSGAGASSTGSSRADKEINKNVCKPKFLLRQLNIGKRFDAYTNINTIIEKDSIGKDLQVILLQEPNRRATLSGGTIYKTHDKKFKTVRAAIYVKDNLADQGKAQLLTEYTDDNHVAVDLTLKLPGGNEIKTVLCSWYMPSDVKNADMITDTMDRLIMDCKRLGKEVIIAADCNAKNERWGSKSNNVRGEKLMDWIKEVDLMLLNNGTTPTFVPDPLEPDKRFSSIDITLATPMIAKLLNNWEVLTDNSYSDHRWIQFDMSVLVNEGGPIRSKRATDWRKFMRIMAKSDAFKKLSKLEYNLNIEELDDAAQEFMVAIMAAYHKSSKKRKKPIYKKQPWYNAKLLNLRREMRQAYRGSTKAPNREELRIEARRLKYKYFRACNKARRRSWRDMIADLEETKDIARMQKFMEHGASNKISSIMKEDGSYTTNASETQNELMKTHFIGAITVEDNEEWREELPEQLQLSEEEINDILEATSIEIIDWAISSFSPFKSPGDDGVFPALLQKSKSLIAPILQKLFRASLITGYIPKAWRGTKVTFIPKTGKESHQTASSYRPISLMSFILKTLEKVLDKRVRYMELAKDPLDEDQHAYRTGRGTESALHSVVHEAEKAIESKGYCLMTVIDICGAFNAISLKTLVEAAGKKGVSKWAIRWIQSMLKNRRLTTSDPSCALRYIPEIGVAQGGSLSPLLWVIVADELIVRLKAVGLKVVAYADDLAILVSGKIPAGLEIQMNKAFRIIERWCRETGLDVNPDKTDMILFTNKHTYKTVKKRDPSNSCAAGVRPTDRICVIKDIKLKGKKIPISDKVKYLGIILDQKLNMNEQLAVMKNKANGALWAASSLCRRTWGLQPKKMHYIYSSIILPRLAYGCLVFWHKFVREPNNISRLTSIRTLQRRAAMMISGASRNVPTVPLLALLNLTPLEIIFEKKALEAFVRLKRNSVWKERGSVNGHCKIEELAKELELSLDIEDISPKWRPTKKFVTSIEIRLGTGPVGRGDVFTDAAVKNDCAGIGWHEAGPDSHEFMGKLKLPCSSSTAEMIAIKEASLKLLADGRTNERFTFWTDSLQCVEALNKPLISKRETWSCSNALNDLAAKGNKIMICWISKKTGNWGTVKADQLARKGMNAAHPSVANMQQEKTNKLGIYNWERGRKKAVWERLLIADGFSTAKIMLKGFDDARMTVVPSLCKSKLRLITAICTGAAPLNGFLSKIKRSDSLRYTDRCRFCKSYKEDMLHLFGDCASFKVRVARQAAFNKMDLSTSELMLMEVSSLLKFAEDIGLPEMILIRDTAAVEDSLTSSDFSINSLDWTDLSE